MERRGAVIRREDDMDDGGRQPNGGEETVGSCDVNALYPSLKKKECAEVVGRLVREIKVKVVGVNYEWVGVGRGDKHDGEEGGYLQMGTPGTLPGENWKEGGKAKIGQCEECEGEMGESEKTSGEKGEDAVVVEVCGAGSD